ncbi:hypothetical protein GE061_007344 [Apolygus lucorum]|uniref:Phosphatidylinositol 3-kinase catalytic subunit type 3 n=1 Tax=Apolygus lucorum TaxID=248454 RepID=A0A6A4JB48_APOLU|nr:hypothetical protein GE061_007344 [Apolygus lucorum]
MIEREKILHDPMLKFSGLYSEGSGKADLMVVSQVWADGRPLCLPVWTSYKPFTNRWNWSEWITLPIMYSDLPQNALLTMTVYDCVGPAQMSPVGGTTLPLFGKRKVYRQGMLDLKVWPGKEADGIEPTTTPGKTPSSGKERMQKLAKLAKKHRNGYMPEIDWLDRLTFREIEHINEAEKRQSNYLYLMVEFPQVTLSGVNHSIVWYGQDGDEVYQFRCHVGMVTVPDPEILQDNLVESKHHKLARSVRSGISDKDVKPNADTRDLLHTIVSYPPTQNMTLEEQDLVWRHRFYLSSNKKALTKFLRCVNFKGTSSEVQQALHLLHSWSPMDVDDALQLLGPGFTFPPVRRYAVTRLQQAPDEDLFLYLLQLVQALKYESFEEITEAYKQSLTKIPEDSLTSSDRKTEGSEEELESKNMDLATFLIHRACDNSMLANYFYWYLMTECEDHDMIKPDNKVKSMYLCVMKRFLQQLKSGPPEWQEKRNFITRQDNFISQLVKLIKLVAKESGNRTKKTEKLQALLADPEQFKINFSNFEPFPLPLEPSVMVKAILPEKATLFKSALTPAKLTFVTTDNNEYVTIFKLGDDLRQDQLVLQIITLMDNLLRAENLDLKLTPYRVLATSTKHGLVQYIDSLPVAEVLTTEGSIQAFFRKHHPCSTRPNGIASDIMDTYVRSCAGYCVITYLLGVGDRHLDNLMLTTSGKLFHIDFGYILGRDPKPLPPPMKLSKEMVDGMGGVNSEYYKEFRKQCYFAFQHLRRHASLILNLFSLMTDASVPDIALEPDKTVKKVLDKLKLDLGDEEAVLYLQNLLDMSVSAVMPALVEQIHKFVKILRN